jgi:hypothetical protein
MNLAVTCPSHLNDAAVAGYYSQMTGVLAGFAFTAMIFLMTSAERIEISRNPKVRYGAVILTLVAAFVSLLITTLTYAVLAGQTSDDTIGRAATLHLVNGLTFGLAVIMLFRGVTLLMEMRDFDKVVLVTARIITVVVAPTLAMYYLSNGAASTESIRSMFGRSSVCKIVPKHPVGMWLSIALPVLLFASFHAKLRPLARRLPSADWSSIASIAVLSVSALAAIVAGDIANRSPGFLMSSAALTTYLCGVFMLLLAIGLILNLETVNQEGQGPPNAFDPASNT